MLMNENYIEKLEMQYEKETGKEYQYQYHNDKFHTQEFLNWIVGKIITDTKKAIKRKVTIKLDDGDGSLSSNSESTWREICLEEALETIDNIDVLDEIDKEVK